jgi:hypothetical protein
MKSKKDLLDHLKPVKANTPDSVFFETLATQVVQEYPIAKTQWQNNFRIFKMALAAAAVLVLAFVLMKSFSIEAQNTNTEKPLLSEIQDEAIFAYVDEHIDEFSLEEITENLTEEDLNFLFENQSNELDFFFAEISDQEIMNYINKENLDLDEFEDELLIF